MSSDYCLLAAVSLISAVQMVFLARRVEQSRTKHSVIPPATTGHPEFERTVSAHQNCVEFYPVFLVALWTSGFFFNEALAVLGGVVFLLARQMFFNGYVNSTKSRLRGFYLSLGTWFMLAAMGAVGVFHGILHDYFDVNVRKMIHMR